MENPTSITEILEKFQFFCVIKKISKCIKSFSSHKSLREIGKFVSITLEVKYIIILLFCTISTVFFLFEFNATSMNA